MQLVAEVLSRLEGAYGLLFKSAYYPGELVACKRGSPLLLGIKELPSRTPLSSPVRRHLAGDSLEAFIASDASAFVEHTKQCAALSPFTLRQDHEHWWCLAAQGWVIGLLAIKNHSAQELCRSSEFQLLQDR